METKSAKPKIDCRPRIKLCESIFQNEMIKMKNEHRLGEEKKGAENLFLIQKGGRKTSETG